MTSDDDLSTDAEVVADPKFCDTSVGGPTSTALQNAELTVDLAEVVTVVVASSADLAEVGTVGVVSSANLTGVSTIGYDDPYHGSLYGGLLPHDVSDEDDSPLLLSDFDEPIDYELYHDLHGDSDCGEYCVSHGDVTTAAPCIEEYTGCDVTRSDAVLPRTDSDESSAELVTGVVGAVAREPPGLRLGAGGGGGLKWCPVFIQGARA